MKHSVFFNVSNHPSTKWAEGQVKAVSTLFRNLNREAENVNIVDIPFPNISPEATPFDIQKKVDELFQEFFDYYDWDTDGVVLHIMGEMGFTFQAVTRAVGENLPVVHSTSERKTQETVNADGTTTKTSVFEFVQFRPY